MNKNKTDSKYINYDHLDKIGEVAVYYGFTPTKSPTITKEDIDAAKDITDGDYVDDETEDHKKLPLHVEEKIALIRMYHEQNMHIMQQPVMLYFKDPCKNIGGHKSSYHRYANLEILGSSGPIAEATIIQTARVMLAEEGYTSTAVEINSIGDRDSINRFSRELIAYYRKQINDMPAVCRELFKKDPFELLASRDKECLEINAKAPRALDFLTETSRKHLEETLEYLEALQIPYNVNNGLLGNRKYCTETVFTIIDTKSTSKERRILGVGMRYNNIAKRLSMKRDVQGIGISLLIKGNKDDLRKTITKTKRPVASFIQLSLESKLLSLEIIEKLRQAKIPLYLSLAKDRLGAQVSNIEKYNTPYVIVIGKKEAMDRTAVVRKNDTHSQDIVPLDELGKYMKKVEGNLWKKK
ncbi:MAG: His/Gly/Thr/Pro-type tRNA ligase C-terminal domain-containing protein [Candidatus Paceibacterota bacterium]|jgi:histidyl-tRNA synthetase